jgi:O-antigen/teichoic acid export membrane protein
VGTLLNNITSLFVLQASLYLIPLVITPYLARTLGVTDFGLLGMGSAIVSYVSLVTDWGFALSATQKVARHASDPAALRRIYWNTLFAKALLCSIALTVAWAAIWFVPQVHEIIPILLILSLTPVTGVVGAGWFLQGLEKIVSFATIMFATRLLLIPLVLTLVHTPEDVVVVAAINTGLGIVSSVISLFAVNRAVRLLPIHFDLSDTWQHVRAGSSTFLSIAGIKLYTETNIVLVGMIAGPIQVGLFVGADKIQMAVLSLIWQISTAIYPRINKLLVSNPKESHRLMRLTLILQGSFGLFLSMTMFLSAGIVTRLFLGNQFIDAIPIIRWLSVVPFLVSLSNAIGVNMMFPFQLKKELAAITLSSGVFNVAMLSVLTYAEGALGAAISVVMTQALVTLGTAWTVYAKRKIVFQIHEA